MTEDPKDLKLVNQEAERYSGLEDPENMCTEQYPIGRNDRPNIIHEPDPGIEDPEAVYDPNEERD